MISLRFTGTGALGSFRCKNKFSKDYRRFPSLCINERILIDPSEDLFDFLDTFSLGDILVNSEDILITHSHLGHFSLSALEKLSGKRSVRIYASEQLGEDIRSINGASFIPLSPYSPVRIGEFDLIPCPSNHLTDIPGECAFNFFFKGEKNIFYGLDGAFIHPSAIELVKSIPCDVFVLDCNEGYGDYSAACAYHNNLEGALALRRTLINSGAAQDGARFILSHLPSYKKESVHDRLCELTAEYKDVRIAYDGYYLGI